MQGNITNVVLYYITLPCDTPRPAPKSVTSSHSPRHSAILPVVLTITIYWLMWRFNPPRDKCDDSVILGMIVTTLSWIQKAMHIAHKWEIFSSVLRNIMTNWMSLPQSRTTRQKLVESQTHCVLSNLQEWKFGDTRGLSRLMSISLDKVNQQNITKTQEQLNMHERLIG